MLTTFQKLVPNVSPEKVYKFHLFDKFDRLDFQIWRTLENGDQQCYTFPTCVFAPYNYTALILVLQPRCGSQKAKTFQTAEMVQVRGLDTSVEREPDGVPSLRNMPAGTAIF